MEEPRYTNECYQCEHNWLSYYDDEECPECGEFGNVGTDILKEN